MQAEIVMIGTELLLGQIVDTNAAFIGRILAENGINLFQKTTVGDNPERIVRALETALTRADAVLTSGGLGPTEDDLTRDCIADLAGQPLEFRQDLFDELGARFASFGRPMSENNKKQAYAPRGAIALENPRGTAPGLIVECGRGAIIAMPGVPKELEVMLVDRVVPYLRTRFGLTGLLHYRVLKVCGMGESTVDTAIGDLMTSLENPKIGLLASPEAVKIRISARANTLDEANALIDQVEAQVRDRLPGRVMGVDCDTLESVVDRLLTERGWSIAVLETNTGGMIAQRLTAAKAEKLVGAAVVPMSRFEGEELEEAAVREAQQIRSQLNADTGLALIGDATNGRAFAGFVSPEGTSCWDVGFGRLDHRNQLWSATICLERLRGHLAEADTSRIRET